MAKRGGRRKKKRTHVPVDGASSSSSRHGAEGQRGAASPASKVPKSLVLRRGKTAHEVAELVQDMRHMMMPFTALQFQEDAKNRKLTLQQYAKHVALPMGISHILAFSQNDHRLNLRLGRTPEGPTLHFRVHQFSLSKQIKALQRRPVANTAGLQANPPVVVTNNFGDSNASSSGQNAAVEPHIKLMRITFQNLFPAINVATVKLAECRRVVLFNLISTQVKVETKTKINKNDDGDNDNDNDKESSAEEETTTKTVPMVEMRHYAIQANAVGVGRRVRKISSTSKRKLPNLHKVNDIADYVTGQTSAAGGSVVSDAAPSDSEAEDDPRHTVQLPDSYMGHSKSQTSALKLVELGPRLSLSLVKVEKGLGAGDVLYHAHVQKTPEEAAALKAKKEREASLKEQRRATQQANVERKRKALEDKRDAKRKRKEERQDAVMQQLGQQGGGVGVDQDDDFEEEDSSDSGEDENDDGEDAN